MSGPKIDYAELERQRKAELERQRQERIRAIREEAEKLNSEIVKTKTQIDHINRYLASVIRDIENKDEMAVTMHQLNALKNSYKAQLIKTLGINVPTEPDAISRCAKKLANETNSIMEDFSREAKPLEERIQDYHKQLEIQNTVASLSDKFSTEIETMKNIEDFDFSATLKTVSCSGLESSVKQNAEHILTEIEGLVNSESIQKSDMTNLLAIAANVFKTAFETKKSYETAVIEYNITKAAISKNIAVFDDIYQDYYAEYIAYMELINSHLSEPVQIVPKRKYRFDSIEELQNETALLSQKIKIASERNYIREQIDDVMRMFGYDVSNEIVLDANQSGNHYVCENKSGKAAIHIHLSDKKQIMMEVVGIGKSAGTAAANAVTGIMVQSADLENHERNTLLDEQGSFCKLHPQIVDELKKRGVLLQMKTRKEPDIKYCSKLVHLSANDNTVLDELINDEYEYNENAGKRGRKKQELRLRALK